VMRRTILALVLSMPTLPPSASALAVRPVRVRRVARTRGRD
jgi:hypothetical protein